MLKYTQFANLGLTDHGSSSSRPVNKIKMVPQEKVKNFITRFPLLLSTAKKLNEAGVEWMIGGSGCLFLLGNKRLPEDIDIFLPNDQHDIADELFEIDSYSHISPAGPVRNSNPENNHSIQLTSHLEFNFGKHYEFAITPSVIQNKIPFDSEGEQLFLLPPEDVLLIKGLLQRGPEEGKEDIEDINNFMEIYEIDRFYLSQRIKDLGAEQRVGAVFGL
jgi:predicted nucleotidyltransferase